MRLPTLVVTLAAISVTGCTTSAPVTAPNRSAPECIIVYDAGSTESRVFVYKIPSWDQYNKKKGPALANGGNINQSISLANDVADMIDQIDGFSLKTDCPRVSSVNLYATAGMRLVEQNDPATSSQLWKAVLDSLQRKHPGTPVNVRTITGFEEGLFDWLSVHSNSGKTDFGVAAMGGASSQVAFPCVGCPTAQIVYIGDQRTEFYSRSYLGIGANQLPDSLLKPVPNECAWGAKLVDASWKAQKCINHVVPLFKPEIKDRHNVVSTVPTESVVGKYDKHLNKWVLTGNSFFYLDSNKNKRTDLQNCCETKGGGKGKNPQLCYDEAKSCVLAIYKHQFLAALGLDPTLPAVEKLDINWTKGAAICALNDCTRDADLEQHCRWLPSSMCLSAP